MKDTTFSLRLKKEDLAFIKQKAKLVNMNTSK
jgi:predicted DNA binding CopG/RHH family protein